ncbi:MAG: glycoside hydrolase family 88 protein [Propionibacteriaceae bacterium]|jgi:unsaturated chondroitin disaccharide hydrolase|nr:glycoside hydrolase family 88 protein [Propionibacteriaceae bacterium]
MSDTIDVGVARTLEAVERDIASFGPSFPDNATVDGKYLPRPSAYGMGPGGNYGWTTSFRTAERWMAWQLDGDDKFKEAALEDVGSFERRIFEGIDTDTHDLGFLYSLSSIPAWGMVGLDTARRAALAAADKLMTRFWEKAGIIQAWGSLDDPEQSCRTIIDSLMNTPLLYWATQETGDSRYAEAAHRHTAALRDNIVRPDDSTFHTFYWDAKTGEPLRGATHQGYSDSSCWARGQAWGIYGFSLGYRYTGDVTFLETAERCAKYFLAHLPADHVSYWDLVFTDGSGEPRDSSAAAIAACGLLEMAEMGECFSRTRVAGGSSATAEEIAATGELPMSLTCARDVSEEVEYYRGWARKIVDSLAENYTDLPADSTAMIAHGVYSKPGGAGVDEANLWGDYFYMEALMRLAKPEWRPYW